MSNAFLYIETQDALVAAAADLAGAQNIALDAEMSGMYTYRSRVCLIQYAARGVEAVIDTMAVRDLSPLAPILEDANVTKVMHGAGFDVRCLKADFGLNLRGLVDTYVAAQMLNWPKLGLADLVSEHAGVVLDKELQTVDWRMRPLTEEHFSYLRSDVRYLENILAIVRRALEEKDLVEEAQIEFARVEAVPGNAEDIDPEGWRRVKGVRELDRSNLGVFRELWLLREAIAESEDRPPARLIANPALLSLARNKPTDLRGLKRCGGLPRHLLEVGGEQFLQAIARGVAAGEPPPLPRSYGESPSQAERQARRDREEKLKQWRRAEAEARGVHPMAILPTYLMETLIQSPVQSAEDLAARPGMGRRRAERYGDFFRSL